MATFNYSIIIPHYNIPDRLIKLLESIPQRDDLEVIVVDDKSDSRLEEFDSCKKEFETERCIFVANTSKFKGAGMCRNIGIELARGKWLLFADSDDMFTDNFYEVINENRDSQDDIIFFMPTSVNSDTGRLSNRHEEFCVLLNKYLVDASFDNELLLRYHIVSPWSKMIRRTMVMENNIRFNNSRVANDMMFCRKIGLFAGKISVKNDVIYVVTEREGSLTKLISKDNYEIRLNEFILCANYVRNHVDADTWKRIDMNGGIFIHMCLNNKLGIMELIKTLICLTKNKISIR